MAKQDVGRLRRRTVERRAERADTGPGIEDHEAPVVEAYLDARRVAAVPDGIRTGRRQRTPRPPEPGAHSGLLGSLPEHRQPADELIALHPERHGDDLEVASAAIDRLDAQVPVAGDAAPERLGEREVLERDRSPRSSTGLKVFASSASAICASA